MGEASRHRYAKRVYRGNGLLGYWIYEGRGLLGYCREVAGIVRGGLELRLCWGLDAARPHKEAL